MPTLQELSQAAARLTGGTMLNFNGDWMALFDTAGIAAGTFNGRMLAWINSQLGTTYTEINGAMQALLAVGSQPTTPVTGLLYVTTKSKVATGFRATTTLDSSIVGELITFSEDASEVRWGQSNWWALASVSGEQAGGSAMSLEGELEDMKTGLRSRFLFGGANVGSVSAGGDTLSDALLPSAFGLSVFPKGGEFRPHLRRTCATPSGSDGLPWNGTNQSLTWENEYEYQYSSATSSAAAIAAAYLDVAPALIQFAKDGSNNNIGATTGIGRPNAGASGISVQGGSYFVGKAVRATRSVAIIGNSLADGTNDTQTPQPTRDGTGPFMRGLRDAAGLPLAGTQKITMPGDRIQWFNGVHTKRGPLCRFANIVILKDAHNDLAGGRTAAQVAADYVTAATYAKAQGALYVVACKTPPFTTSTDSWATVANQTPQTGWETGGAIRDAFHAALTAAAGPGNPIDIIWDFNAAIADATQPDRWKANYTVDGIHWNSSACVATGPAVQALYAALPALLGGSAT